MGLGVKIEAAGPGDEPLVGDELPPVLEWLRAMVKAGNVHDDARAENGETFQALRHRRARHDGHRQLQHHARPRGESQHEVRHRLLPGIEPGSSASFIGGDLVVVPKGSKRVDDAVDFMKFILSDEVQVEGYAKLLNLTTRSDMVENKYFKAEPLVQDVAKALNGRRTPYTLTFFEQINSPQGPWLQMLQRAYYTDDDRPDHQDAKAPMKAIAGQ